VYFVVLGTINLVLAPSITRFMEDVWIEYFMADNPLLEFQSRLFNGPVLREEVTQDGIFVPPDGPGLGLELDAAVAPAALVPE
jgi:L-alanine-DL-glutamate epimerase-like enolase superfamily enzyme